jgi:hypothetical protein
MHFDEVNADLPPLDQSNSENSLRQQETMTRLQYTVAFLIEKNERLRQELTNKSSDKAT